jgi:hypothetical protein
MTSRSIVERLTIARDPHASRAPARPATATAVFSSMQATERLADLHKRLGAAAERSGVHRLLRAARATMTWR